MFNSFFALPFTPPTCYYRSTRSLLNNSLIELEKKKRIKNIPELKTQTRLKSQPCYFGNCYCCCCHSDQAIVVVAIISGLVGRCNTH